MDIHTSLSPQSQDLFRKRKLSLNKSDRILYALILGTENAGLQFGTEEENGNIVAFCFRIAQEELLLEASLFLQRLKEKHIVNIVGALGKYNCVYLNFNDKALRSLTKNDITYIVGLR